MRAGWLVVCGLNYCLTDMHCARDRGIKFRKGTTVTAFEGEDGKVWVLRVGVLGKRDANDFLWITLSVRMPSFQFACRDEKGMKFLNDHNIPAPCPYYPASMFPAVSVGLDAS